MAGHLVLPLHGTLASLSWPRQEIARFTPAFAPAAQLPHSLPSAPESHCMVLAHVRSQHIFTCGAWQLPQWRGLLHRPLLRCQKASHRNRLLDRTPLSLSTASAGKAQLRTAPVRMLLVLSRIWSGRGMKRRGRCSMGRQGRMQAWSCKERGKEKEAWAGTCGGVVHVALVALLWRLLPLPHVVCGVVAERGHKEAAHPQRERHAAQHNKCLLFMLIK